LDVGRTLVVLLLLARPAAAQSIPATDITAADVEATKRTIIATKAIDMPIRTVDAGGHNIGVGVVHRFKGTVYGGSFHDKVSEVYHVIEGAGTLVTGGTLLNPQRRESSNDLVTQINGPGVSGSGIQGGVSRRVTRGDVVIIPAGTPHWFSNVEADITYTVVRVDPSRVVTLK
jgi:mannose-6-phosphate isomerase-like protein (cupin superfamily)